MTNSLWTEQGATLSLKNACQEYGLTERDILDAMKAGKLQFRENYAHGNPYFKLLRGEVEALALALRGAAAMEEQAFTSQLRQIDKEINSYKRKLTSLQKQRLALIETRNRQNRLAENKTEESSAPRPQEIYPSSYLCVCGHESDFSENTIKEAKAKSQKRKIHLSDSAHDEHTIVFHKGEMIDILCPLRERL